MRTIIIVMMLLYAMPALAKERSGMTATERKTLDTLCSNFSETQLAGFEQGQLSDADMLSFALSHARINKRKAVREAKDHMAIFVPAAVVDRVTEKYFGKKIARQPLPEYKLVQASGETYTFSQVTRLTPQGNDRFLVEGRIFTAGSGATIDPHADPLVWKKADEEVSVSGKFMATFQQTGDRYVLLAYQVRDTRPIRGCEERNITSSMVEGIYQGINASGDDVCLASVKTDDGKVLQFRCADIEASLDKAKGKRVFLLLSRRQFWNEPAAACDRAVFFEWGSVLSPAN